MTTGWTTAPDAPAGFAHSALIVSSDRTLTATLVPVLDRLIQADQPVLLVVSNRTEAIIRDALGPAGDRAQWGDPAGFYQRLGFAYERFRRCLADQHTAGSRVTVVAEPEITSAAGPEAPVDRTAAYLAYESVCNETYAPYGCPVTCIWDSRRQSPAVIDEVRLVHPHELTAAGIVPSRAYLTPKEYLARRNEVPLDDVPPHASPDLRLGDAAELGRLRAALRSAIDGDPFDDQGLDDIVLTVTEIAANGLAHGAAPVRVRAWHHDSGLSVQVDDTGGLPLPADAGYRRPAHGETLGGRGLWLARQLADVVSTHSRPGNTSVRLYFPFDRP